MSSPSDSSSTSPNYFHFENNEHVRVEVNNNITQQQKVTCPCNGGVNVSTTNKNDIDTPSITQAAVADADAPDASDATDTTSKSVPKAVAKEKKVMSAEEGALEYPPLLNSARALILPKDILPDARAKVDDDHVTKFVHLLPHLDKSFEKYKGKTVEATRQAKDALIKVLLDMMDVVKKEGGDAIKRKVVDNFKTLAVERGHNETCLNFRDVKRIISNSKERMNRNPFYVLEICHDHAYELTKAHSSFIGTELTEAIIAVGERQTMKWTVSREEGAQHSLVAWANKGASDTLRQLNNVQRNCYGTATYYKIPKLPPDKMNQFFFTLINHGHRVVYLQSRKKTWAEG